MAARRCAARRRSVDGYSQRAEIIIFICPQPVDFEVRIPGREISRTYSYIEDELQTRVCGQRRTRRLFDASEAEKTGSGAIAATTAAFIAQAAALPTEASSH